MTQVTERQNSYFASYKKLASNKKHCFKHAIHTNISSIIMTLCCPLDESRCVLGRAIITCSI